MLPSWKLTLGQGENILPAANELLRLYYDWGIRSSYTPRKLWQQTGHGSACCAQSQTSETQAALHVACYSGSYLNGGLPSSGTPCIRNVIPTGARSGTEQASQESSTIAVLTVRLYASAECSICMLHVSLRQ